MGPSPTGAFAGRAHSLAGYSAGGWRFVDPVVGLQAVVRTSGETARYVGGGWVVGVMPCARVEVAGQQVVSARASAIPNPNGGAVVDVEARATLSSILAALRTHGLIAP